MSYKKSRSSVRSKWNTALIILAYILIAISFMSCNKYYSLEYYPPSQDETVYYFRNRKGTEYTVVDSMGVYEYGMKKVTLKQIKQMAR
jgi:hypothetical protein